MCPDPNDEYASGPDGGKECPVCDQEYNGVCPLRSSDCPFAYDATPDDINLDDEEEEASLIPDIGLEDDFADSEEDDEDVDLLAGADGG